MPRAPRSFPPPHILDPAVRAVLQLAMTNRERVVIHLRGNASTGTVPSTITGVPVRSTPSRDGRPRIALQAKSDETQQLVLVEQIERVERVAR